MASPPGWQVHPLRETLHNEVHARPYEALTAPAALSHLAFAVPPGSREADMAHLADLLQRFGAPAPGAEGNHLSLDLGEVRVRWERHTEFVTYTFWRPGGASQDVTALAALPADWLAQAPGELLVALHLEVIPGPSEAVQQEARRRLADTSLTGALVADGQISVYTDFHLGADGFGHWLVGVHGHPDPRRLGRNVQRVLEIETYRMMALLGLPHARTVSQALSRAESELVALSQQVRDADKRTEPALLERLTRMAGEIESLYARHHARFSASAAYFELVHARVGALREARTGGLQTLREFIDRRLNPAMQTCAWAERRLKNISQRVSHISELLRTRVEIEQAQSQQALLETMTRRQRVQLLLQSTVEGLSVAAITYYGSGLMVYLVKAAQSVGWNLPTDLTVAATVPVIAVGTWLGLRKLHGRVEAEMRD